MTILSTSLSGKVFAVEETLANTHFLFAVEANGVETGLTIDLSQPSALAAVQMVFAALAKEATISVLYDPASTFVQQISWSRV